MIELKEALTIVLDSARPLGSERVGLADALGRVLAENVAADRDMPPFDKATVDGFACRRVDLGKDLTVIETIPAGAAPTKTLEPNQCAKIMTGAPLPFGTECVIMIEHTQNVDGNAIRFTGTQTPDHISRQGQEVRRGQIVLQKGARIRPPHVAALASVGCVRPLMAVRPRVAVVVGGDELVEPAATPGPFQIRSSNGLQLIAQLGAMGIAARDYGIMKDTEADVDRVLRMALAENDVVLVSGGVSVGDFDFVPGVLRQNHVRLLFDKIAVQPGKPTVFGVAASGWCFGLPGNPVSTYVIFELLVKPFLCRLMGCEYSPRCVQMRLGEPVSRKETSRQSWIPVRMVDAGTVAPVEYRGSGHIFALCDADGLIALDIGVKDLPEGALVQVRLF
ncbi:MAG: gephyrin-like molybdotransferase Glp [Phycisphaerales bacterium]